MNAAQAGPDLQQRPHRKVHDMPPFHAGGACLKLYPSNRNDGPKTSSNAWGGMGRATPSVSPIVRTPSSTLPRSSRSRSTGVRKLHRSRGSVLDSSGRTGGGRFRVPTERFRRDVIADGCDGIIVHLWTNSLSALCVSICCNCVREAEKSIDLSM